MTAVIDKGAQRNGNTADFANTGIICKTFSGHLNQKDVNLSTPVKLLQHIRESDIVDAYPKVKAALSLYLTLPVANTERERSFLPFSEQKAGCVLTLRKRNSVILIF